MSFKIFTTNLETLLNELVGSGQKLVEVKPYPGLDFNGYPSAFIAPSGSQGDYHSSQANTRVFAFKIWVIQSFKKSTIENAYSICFAAIDDILDKIDEQENPSSARELANNLPSKYTLVNVNATVGNFVSDEVDKFVACEITASMRVLVDLTQLS